MIENEKVPRFRKSLRSISQTRLQTFSNDTFQTLSILEAAMIEPRAQAASIRNF
jgi:hypothetical protein